MDTTTITSSSRVKVLDFPVALPGKCVICGSVGGDGRKFIDIGFELDFYGVIYFCEYCFSQTATGLGYIAPSLFKVIELENEELAYKVSLLEAENVKLRTALSELDFLGTRGISGVAEHTAKSPVKREKSPDPKPAKQINEPGSSNVPKTGSNKQSTDFEELL